MGLGSPAKAHFYNNNDVHLTANMRYVGATTFDYLTLTLLDTRYIANNPSAQIVDYVSVTD